MMGECMGIPATMTTLSKVRTSPFSIAAASALFSMASESSPSSLNRGMMPQ